MIHSIHEFKNGLRFYDYHLAGFNHVAEDHEPVLEAIFRLLIEAMPADGSYVNLGASIGIYPLFARRLARGLKIHAYEPLEKHRGYFLESIALNGFQPEDFQLYEEGVSREDGHIDYYENGFGSTIISKCATTLQQRLKQVRLKVRRWLMDNGIANYQLQFKRISVVSLATVLDRCGGKIDLLQMDVQGSEGDILEGGQALLASGVIQTFVISTHGAPLHGLCKNLLEHSGYRVLHDDRQEKHDGLLVCQHQTSTPVVLKLPDSKVRLAA